MKPEYDITTSSLSLRQTKVKLLKNCHKTLQESDFNISVAYSFHILFSCEHLQKQRLKEIVTKVHSWPPNNVRRQSEKFST